MSLNLGELVDELQAEMGNDTSVVTDSRAKRWINAAIRKIARDYPSLNDVHVLDKTTLSCEENRYSYSLLVFTDKPVGPIISLKYIGESNSDYWVVSPFVGGLEAWDSTYPYISSLDTGAPVTYIRRANDIEVYPMPGSSEVGARLWLEYGQLPRNLVNDSDTPILTDFDEEIIQMGKLFALRFKSVNDPSVAVLAENQRRLVDTLLNERWELERIVDVADRMPDYGP